MLLVLSSQPPPDRAAVSPNKWGQQTAATRPVAAASAPVAAGLLLVPRLPILPSFRRSCPSAAGERLVMEQDMVNSLKLSDEYLKKQKGGPGIIGLKG